MNYDEKEVLNSLMRKGVVVKNKILEAKRNSLGNKSLGRVDFLKNYKGYLFKWSR